MKNIQFIAHRINTIAALKSLQDNSIGCEIDLRSDINSPGSLIMTHDPWSKGDNFSDWLAQYAKMNFSGPLILNTKEDGLEETVIRLLEKEKVENYFFLDTTVPTLVKWAVQKKNTKFAVRLSAYEPLDYVLRFKESVEWVWVDCFQVMPLPVVKELKEKSGMKICLVSPELQGGSEADFPRFLEWMKIADAVCTKKIDVWKRIL